MGIRTDKGKSVARFLTGHTGIPLLSWDGAHSRVIAPPPYTFDVTTSRKLQNWHDLIRGYATSGTARQFAIRYDNSLESVDQAWVGMNLQTFTDLLSAHYERIRPRVQTYVEGD